MPPDNLLLPLCAQTMQTSLKKCFGGILQVAITQEALLRAQASIKKFGSMITCRLFGLEQQYKLPLQWLLARHQRHPGPRRVRCRDAIPPEHKRGCRLETRWCDTQPE